jgi:hypothetical protein
MVLVKLHVPVAIVTFKVVVDLIFSLGQTPLDREKYTIVGDDGAPDYR